MLRRAGGWLVGLTVLLGALTVPPAAAEGADSAVVLMYHRFGESEHPSTNVTMEQFRAHVAELTKGPYNVAPLPEVVTALREGRALPDRTVVITVDDAYASLYTEAWPVLRQHNLPFTLFVSTEAVDRGYGGMLTWEQMRTMHDSGLMSVGNHTVSHLHMPDHGPERNRRELEEAGRRIEAELGVEADILAYPYGEYSAELEALVARMGFRAAFGQHSGVVGSQADNWYGLPRFALNESYGDMDRFRLAVNALPLPVTEVQPADPLVRPATNPPRISFRVGEAAGALDNLRCFVSGRGAAPLRLREDRRVTLSLEEPLGPGRTRLNCTLQAQEGRWRWFGRQFYRPAQ